MVHLTKGPDRGSRKVTPPSPTYMSNDQFAAYLAELRNNRVARPGGARPLPANKRQTVAKLIVDRVSLGHAAPENQTSETERHGNATRSHISTGSIASRRSLTSPHAWNYSQETSVAPLKPSEVVPSATYMERGQRWMEREEAVSLREAMHDMDLTKDSEKPNDAEGDEARIYQAALDEASELVWQHQNEAKPRQPDAPYQYRPHLKKNSYAHARTASVSSYGSLSRAGGSISGGSRSVSTSSNDSHDSQGNRASASTQNVGACNQHNPTAQPDIQPARPSKSYGAIGSVTAPTSNGRRRSSVKRNISGEIDHPFSGDQIWEEPEPSTPDRQPVPAAALGNVHSLGSRGGNPVAADKAAAQPKSVRLPWMRSRVEIHKNPPTQSRNPQYTTNTPTEKPESDDRATKIAGVEVRSDDIRQATSMRLSDRSSKLPTPSAVSDSPGRPIVSFNPDWKSAEEPHSQRSNSRTATSSIPLLIIGDDDTGTQNRISPAIPSTSVSDDAATITGPQGNIPQISISSPNIPTIIEPGSNDSNSENRPRALPHPASRKRPNRVQRPPWAHVVAPGSRATASCHECGFPIEGRFVALAGAAERFHPQCFSCYTCGTSLEALEISPEPEGFRNERLARIFRRAAREVLDEEPGKTAEDDGDERLRFYCHLDWHELFAPRCKHCKTPILGEHVVALGEHWHYGHFFCAECGDPFEQGMTHIEKDGYAWCVNCQTKRTERRAPKCRRCRKAVIGQYIKALGGEWHDECFRCVICQGTFDDGQIFPREGAGEGVVLCTPCRAVELKQ